MYTVIRFMGEQRESLESIGAGLNAIVPWTFTGMRPAGDGFACDVSESDEWSDHERAISIFIERFGACIARAAELGLRVEFDVAVDSDDRARRLITSVGLPCNVLRRFAELHVDFEVSVHAGEEGAP